MKKIYTIFLFLVTLLSIFISVSGFLVKTSLPGLVFRILLLPVTLYLVSKLTSHITSQTPVFDYQRGWLRVLTTYCLIVSCTLVVAGFMSSRTLYQFAISFIFTPLAGYFLILIWPRSNWTTNSFNQYTSVKSASAPVKLDENRRDFLKMIGAAGLSVLLFNLFSQRTADIPF